MDFEVVDEGPLPGIEELVGTMAEQLDEDGSNRLSESIEATGIPIEKTMGSWDRLSALLDRIRGRRLVRELPSVVVQVPWFHCHVPPGGTVGVIISSSQTAKSSMGLKIYGSSLGRGRQFGISMAEETEPRHNCASYYVAVDVLPKVYEYKGEESIDLEVLGKAGSRIESRDTCPYCGVAPDSMDPLEFIVGMPNEGRFLDYRLDDVVKKKTIDLVWMEERSIEVGFSIPGIGVPFTLSTSTTSESKWTMVYTFAPGHLYQPYRRIDDPGYMPPMWAVG